MDGQQISSPSNVVPPEKRRMSMIFQSYAIWPNMTVGENVGFGLQVRRFPSAEIDRRVDQILDVVQMRGALRELTENLERLRHQLRETDRPDTTQSLRDQLQPASSRVPANRLLE
jgi:ABC-type Fe3+/spermidine/putrescine transport system ATPase subunit